MMQDKKHPCERGVSEKLQSKTAYDVFPVGGKNCGGVFLWMKDCAPWRKGHFRGQRLLDLRQKKAVGGLTGRYPPESEPGLLTPKTIKGEQPP